MTDDKKKPKFNISVTSVPFEGDEAGHKIRTSTFHITMNTNTRIDAPVDEMGEFVEPLQSAANELLGDPDYIEKFLQFPYGGEFNPETVLGIEVTTRVEVGKDDAHGRRLHLHALLKITHNSRVRLSFPILKREMNHILEEKDYPLRVHYLHAEVINDRGERVVRYLKKA